MNDKRLVKRYGIYNSQPCEFVLVKERHTRGSSYQEYRVRPLTNAEVMKRLNEMEVKS